MDQSHSPIFILGVPRSGTTLLRTMLDSHPAIACGPETPWLAGHQPRSVMELCRFLWEREQGYCASFDMPREVVTSAARDFVSRLLNEYTKRRGKRRWAEKTPDNALHIPFLLELFPEAKFIYLTRDGLDVAASTSRTPEHRKGISTWHERHISFGGGAVTSNNPLSALLRWLRWNRIISDALEGHEHLHVSFESLVSRPEETLRQIVAFVGEDYDPAMLRFGDLQHDLPDWEWGTADIKAQPTVSTEPLERARRDLTQTELDILAPLASPRPDSELAEIQPAAALGFLGDLRQDNFITLMRWFNQFAKPLGLRTFVGWSKSWEYPWLWFKVIGQLQHRGLRVVDLGSELSPMPWILGLLGARVTIVETTDRFVPQWTALRDRLRVDVDWVITDSEKIPVPDASADLLTSFSVIEHQPDKEAAIAEAARILKPGAVMALSFDICESSMGMVYPESYGRALTLREFETQIWHHPAFGNTEAPKWLRHHMRSFLQWHLKGSPNHNYVVAASVMTRQA